MKLFGAVLAALLTAALVGGSARSASRIAGGTAIQVQSAPWTVFVQYQDGSDSYYHCTGSILDDLHVVTAAHCLYNQAGVLAQPSELLVDAGLSNFYEPTATDVPQSLGVASFRVHPGYQYTGSSVPDDVAVLTLASPLDLSGPLAQPIALPAAGSTPAGSLEIAGFGRESPSEDATGALNSASVAADAQGQCGEYTSAALIAADNATMSCFTSPAASVCEGDSGSGVVTTGGSPVLVGIVVAADPACAAGDPDIAVDVAAPEILSFIQGNDAPTTAPRLGASRYGLAYKTPLTVGQAVTCAGVATWATPVQTTYSFLDAATGRTLQQSVRPSYTVPASLVGHRVYCVVRVANAGGTLVIQTAASAAVKAKPKAKPKPKPKPKSKPRKKKH